MKIPKLKHVILCDEIRQEDNGKMLVVGMYTGQVVVPTLPFNHTVLTFFCQWQLAPDCGLAGVFELYSPEGEKIREVVSPVADSLPPEGTAFMGIAVRNFRFETEGEYVFAFNPIQGRRRSLYRFSVVDRKNLRKPATRAAKRAK